MIWHALPTDIIIIISIADPNPILMFREGDMILISIWGHSAFSVLEAFEILELWGWAFWTLKILMVQYAPQYHL